MICAFPRNMHVVYMKNKHFIVSKYIIFTIIIQENKLLLLSAYINIPL